LKQDNFTVNYTTLDPTNCKSVINNYLPHFCSSYIFGSLQYDYQGGIHKGILKLSMFSSKQLFIYWAKHLLCAANEHLFLFCKQTVMFIYWRYWTFKPTGDTGGMKKTQICRKTYKYNKCWQIWECAVKI